MKYGFTKHFCQTDEMGKEERQVFCMDLLRRTFKENGTLFISLNSVGSFMTKEQGQIIAYPAFKNDKPDLENGTLLDDLDSFWIESLSNDDVKKIKETFEIDINSYRS